MNTGRISRFSVWVFLAYLAMCGAGAGAEGPQFALPVDCRPGKNCWIVNYFDNDPGTGVRDYACGVRSYDGHGGTDFGIRDLAAMLQGVQVLAAAPGIVRRVRDGVVDITVNEADRHAVEGRECGNGVVIDHTGGWTTQYCHLRRGSLVVEVGDQVITGQPLGLIGLSGLTEFPHVEFVVRYRGKKVDPFVGLEGSPTCAVSSAKLWDDKALAALEYRPLIIFNAGFSDTIPKQDELRRGDHHDSVFTVDAPFVMFWVELFGVRAGDRIQLRIQTPNGDTLVEHWRTLERNQAYRFEFAGKRRRNQNWTAGRYIGEVTIIRGAASAEQRFHHAVEVEIL